MGSQVIGIDRTAIVAASGEPAFRLGTIGGFDDPVNGYQEFIYGKAGDANFTEAGRLALEVTGFTFVIGNIGNSTPGTAGYGTRCAANAAILGNGEYGWFQIYGKGSIRTLASAAIGTRLNTTGTAGAVDDDATAGSEAINGLVLHVATGGATAVNSSAMFSYPTVGVTL